jgi:hypothetical protein
VFGVAWTCVWAVTWLQLRGFCCGVLGGWFLKLKTRGHIELGTIQPALGECELSVGVAQFTHPASSSSVCVLVAVDISAAKGQLPIVLTSSAQVWVTLSCVVTKPSLSFPYHGTPVDS